jgi:hypothetical protein
MRYEFKDGFYLSGSAQRVGEELEALRRRHGGRLTSQHVLVEAMKRRSALHGFFEWDDAQAAQKHRLAQASYLIRAVVVVPEENEPPFEPVRAFVCVSGDEKPRSFTHICAAMRDEDLRKTVIEQARKELAAWRKRYTDLEAFVEVFAAIDAATA